MIRIIGPDNSTWYQLFKISNRDNKERKEKKESEKVCVNVRACMYVCMRLSYVECGARVRSL